MTNMEKVEELVCPECGGRFSRADLTDGDDIVTCENCGRKYPTVEILRKSDGVVSEKIRADVYREVELDKAQLRYKAEIARIEAEREQLQADREIERERLRASSEAERARRRMEERQEKREYKRSQREETRERRREAATYSYADEEECRARAREFKGSKFFKVLIGFSIFFFLMCAVSFNDGRILSGLLAVGMLALLAASFLIGLNIIKVKGRNTHVLPAIVAFALIIPYFSLYSAGAPSGGKNPDHSDDVESIVWEDFVLGGNLPDFGMDEAEVVWDTDNVLILYFYGVESLRYNSYANECKEYGYNIDAKNSGKNYSAYNAEGFYLHLNYSDYNNEGRITIDLERPKKREIIVWPSGELVKDLPVPSSLIGEVSNESSSRFSVYLADMEMSYFSQYVALCMENGFVVDYYKSDDSFSAKNKDGVSLRVEYEGFNTIYIHISE